MKRKLTCLCQRKRLQVTDKTIEQPDLIQRRCDLFGRTLIDAIKHALQITLNDMQRRAQLMGDIRGEIATLLVLAFELACHLVEALD